MFISELEKIKYLAKVILIIYIIIGTDIDIAFTLFMISRFAKNTSLEHFDAIIQILPYLAGS